MTAKKEPKTDYQALYQRALADQENARKRFDTEKQMSQKFALMGFILDLLPVIDNFYRATEHVPEDQKDSPWLTGIQYIQKQLLDLLAQYNVTEIETKPGDPFDSQKHEAIGTVVNDQFQDDQIVEVKNRGYLLHERVLRPAQVIVNTLDTSAKADANPN